MVHSRTILTLYIVILAVNNVLVEAGQGTTNRRENLQERASTHKKVLKIYGDRFTNKFGSSLNPTIERDLTDVTYIIVDHIMMHKSFSQYLESVFQILGTYAERQIKSRFEKLNTIYEKWEKKNFPDKKENKDLEKKNSGKEKKSKKKGDEKSKNKNDGQKKNGK